MWGKLMRQRLLSKILFTSTNIFFCSMEAQKEIKYIDWEKDQWGDYPLIRSIYRSGRAWASLPAIDESLEGQEVLIRARIHNVRGKGNNCFIVLR